MFAALKPSGKLVINGDGAKQSYTLDLQLAGFIIRNDSDLSSLTALRPAWQLGSTAPISLKNTQSSNLQSVWSIDETAEIDLVNEDDLLLDDIPLPKKISGCDENAPVEPGNRRACKNCSCGLAEEEAAALAAGLIGTVEKTAAMKSACGNCSKGDAFRCAGCPFLGKPAFEPGKEKVVLALGDDDI